VNVNGHAGQWRAKNTGEKIAGRKADKDGEEHEQRHAGKEVVVVAAARRTGNGADRLVRLSGDCDQDASVRTWTGEECAPTWELQALYTELVWGALADVRGEAQWPI